MLRTSLHAAWLLTLCGCLPDEFEASPEADVAIDVQRATGGGGDVETATIPIRVEVTVDERRGPSILTDNCRCGCDKQACVCGDGVKCDPFAAMPPKVAESTPEGVPVHVDGAGRSTWTVDGLQWWFDPGVRLNEGQTDGTGRWKYKNGRMIDTSGQRVQRVDTSQAECLDGF